VVVMGKTRKTITIDSELAEIVDRRDEFNLSGFVNVCLEQHFSADGATSPQATALKAKLEQIEEELEDAERKRERLRSRRQEIEAELEDVEDDEPELLEQARDKLANTPKDPDNPAIQNWASKLGMPSEELVEELEQ
jgi:septal ring factor EnvC (AmiA/AmiB activator)